MPTPSTLTIASVILALSACAELTAPSVEAPTPAPDAALATTLVGDTAAARATAPPAPLVSMLDDALMLTAPDARHPMPAAIAASMPSLRVALATGSREEALQHATTTLARVRALCEGDRTHAFELLGETLVLIAERLRATP